MQKAQLGNPGKPKMHLNFLSRVGENEVKTTSIFFFLSHSLTLKKARDGWKCLSRKKKKKISQDEEVLLFLRSHLTRATIFASR